MTPKALEERSRESAVYEISRRLKFEFWQTFVFLKIAADSLLPSLHYQLPSLPSILALKAIIISASSRQPVSKLLWPWSCYCCLAFRSGSSCWVEQQLGTGRRSVGCSRPPRPAWGKWAGDGNLCDYSCAGEREAKASQKPSLHPVCVGVCPPRGAQHPAGAKPTPPCWQTPWVSMGQHLVVPDQGWE